MPTKWLRAIAQIQMGIESFAHGELKNRLPKEEKETKNEAS